MKNYVYKITDGPYSGMFMKSVELVGISSGKLFIASVQILTPVNGWESVYSSEYNLEHSKEAVIDEFAKETGTSYIKLFA